MQILRAETPEHMEMARSLFLEYADYLNVDLCFQDFQQELEGLPGKYAPPEGALLLAIDNGNAAGCVAVRGLEGNTCEMKRLYIRPPFRGTGLGRRLAGEIIEIARQIGYDIMRLDTLEQLTEAMRLYQSFGFQRIDPYYDNPLENVVYWELQLHQKWAPDRR